MYLDNYATHDSCVEVTIRLAALPSPSTLPYNIHDVASTFKHFLGELHGGILGSVDVFESLKKALMPLKMRDEDLDFQCVGLNDGDGEIVNTKWVARVLCSVECAQRRNLIFAVFGLLASLKQDPAMRRSHRTRLFDLPLQIQELGHGQPGTEYMSSKALGVVFAPLLLGNLTDQIRIDAASRPVSANTHNRRRSLLTGGGSPRKPNKSMPPRAVGKSTSMMQLRRHSTIIPVTILESPTISEIFPRKTGHRSCNA